MSEGDGRRSGHCMSNMPAHFTDEPVILRNRRPVSPVGTSGSSYASAEFGQCMSSSGPATGQRRRSLQLSSRARLAGKQSARFARQGVSGSQVSAVRLLPMPSEYGTATSQPDTNPREGNQFRDVAGDTPADQSDNVSEAGTYVIDHESTGDCEQRSGVTPTPRDSLPAGGSSATSTGEGEQEMIGDASSSADAEPSTSNDSYVRGSDSDWIERWVADALRQNHCNRSSPPMTGRQRPCSVAVCDRSELASMLKRPGPIARQRRGVHSPSAHAAGKSGTILEKRSSTSRPDLLPKSPARERVEVVDDGSSMTGTSLSEGKDYSTPTGVRNSAQGYEPKYNRTVSLRRARLVATPKSGSAVPSASASYRASPVNNCLSRNDGGRFSLRAEWKENAGSLNGSDILRCKKQPKPSPKNTICDKNRQELANWKRRSSYNPMLSARAGKLGLDKRDLEHKTAQASTKSEVLQKRSSSFHVDAGGGAAKTNGRFIQDLKHRPVNSQVAKRSLPCQLQRRLSLDATPPANAQPDLKHGQHRVDGSLNVPGTAKKALDNFVINAILTLSKKLKMNSESLVTKLKQNFEEEDVRFTMLEDALSSLSGCLTEGGQVESGSTAASRHLAAILKNLRAVEQTVQVLEQVLCENTDGDFSDVDEEELAALLQKINDEDFH